MTIYVNTDVEIELEEILEENRNYIIAHLGAELPTVKLIQDIYEEVTLPPLLKDRVEDFLRENGGCVYSKVN